MSVQAAFAVVMVGFVVLGALSLLWRRPRFPRPLMWCGPNQDDADRYIEKLWRARVERNRESKRHAQIHLTNVRRLPVYRKRG